MKIDIRRLIKNKSENEKNYIVPEGRVHSTMKIILCEDCSSKDLMNLSPKIIAEALNKIGID